MRITHAIMLAALLVVPAALPAASYASPNDHRFAKSSEGFKKQLQADICVTIQGALQNAENEADKRAGTKAAAKYAKEADKLWAEGEKNGCDWAA